MLCVELTVGLWTKRVMGILAMRNLTLYVKDTRELVQTQGRSEKVWGSVFCLNLANSHLEEVHNASICHVPHLVDCAK